MIIDTHCHPDLKPFSFSFAASGAEQYTNSLNPGHQRSIWHRNSLLPEEGLLEKWAGINWFSQSDLGNLFEGGYNVILHSLYPIEKGFMSGGLVADLGVKAITALSDKFLNHLQNKNYTDYWPMLVKEYEYVKQLASTPGNEKTVDVDGVPTAYYIAKSWADIETVQNMGGGVKRISSVLTIEGAHVFGSGMDRNEADWAKISPRVAELKAWEYPVFIIGIGHHFYNGLCGHGVTLADEAIPKLTKIAAEQRYGTGPEFGITPAGKELINALLDDTNGRRILIDIKHFNPRSKLEYYEILDSDKWKDINPPVVVTHGAVIADDIFGENGFYKGDINFTNADILRIAKSGNATDENGHVPGFFGIQLDERRIASKDAIRAAKVREDKAETIEEKREVWAGLVWLQIWHIAKILDRNDLPAYDIQALGSDFDGMINSTRTFPTAASIQYLREPLIAYGKKMMVTQKALLANKYNKDVSVEEIVDKFLGGNAERFLRAYFK